MTSEFMTVAGSIPSLAISTMYLECAFTIRTRYGLPCSTARIYCCGVRRARLRHEIGRFETEFLQTILHLRYVHEYLPKQSGPIVFDHDYDRALVNGQMRLRIPIELFAESV